MISRLTILAAHTTSSLTFAASSHHDALKDTSSTWGATVAINPLPPKDPAKRYVELTGGAGKVVAAAQTSFGVQAGSLTVFGQ